MYVREIHSVDAFNQPTHGALSTQNQQRQLTHSLNALNHLANVGAKRLCANGQSQLTLSFTLSLGTPRPTSVAPLPSFTPIPTTFSLHPKLTP